MKYTHNNNNYYISIIIIICISCFKTSYITTEIISRYMYGFFPFLTLHAGNKSVQISEEHLHVYIYFITLQQLCIKKRSHM